MQKQLSNVQRSYHFLKSFFFLVIILPVSAAKPTIRGRHSSYTSYSQSFKNTNFQFPFTTKNVPRKLLLCIVGREN